MCRWGMLLIVGSLLAGCGPDLPRMADDMLRQRLVGVERIDAVQFFEDGGYFNDDPDDADDPEIAKLDPHVFALVKRIRDELKLEPFMTFDREDPKEGIDLIVAMPTSKEMRNRLEQVIDEAQKTFPGEIFPQWGHEYLAIDVFDEEDAAWYAEQEGRDKK